MIMIERTDPKAGNIKHSKLKLGYLSVRVFKQ